MSYWKCGLIAVAVLSACGGTSTGDVTTDDAEELLGEADEGRVVVIVDVPEPEEEETAVAEDADDDPTSLVLASTGGGFAGSGLVYASDGTVDVVTDLAPGDSFQVRLVGYQNLLGDSTLTPTLTTETVTFTEDSEGNAEIQITYQGEVLTFDLDELIEFGDGSSTLQSGQAVEVYQNNSVGEVATFGLYTYSYGDFDPIEGSLNAESFLVVGFETNPTDVAARSGTATFLGQWDGYGGVRNVQTGEILNEVLVDGLIDFEVAFDDATISGSLVGFIDTADEPNFTGTMSATPIVGNGFESALEIACTDGITCTSDSRLGGAFFGEEAAEIGGLIALDITGSDDDGESVQLVSGAGFVAQEIGPE